VGRGYAYGWDSLVLWVGSVVRSFLTTFTDLVTFVRLVCVSGSPRSGPCGWVRLPLLIWVAVRSALVLFYTFVLVVLVLFWLRALDCCSGSYTFVRFLVGSLYSLVYRWL